MREAGLWEAGLREVGLEGGWAVGGGAEGGRAEGGGACVKQMQFLRSRQAFVFYNMGKLNTTTQ